MSNASLQRTTYARCSSQTLNLVFLGSLDLTIAMAAMGCDLPDAPV